MATSPRSGRWPAAPSSPGSTAKAAPPASACSSPLWSSGPRPAPPPPTDPSGQRLAHLVDVDGTLLGRRQRGRLGDPACRWSYATRIIEIHDGDDEMDLLPEHRGDDQSRSSSAPHRTQ